MQYFNKYGKFGIYTDGILYRWFKNLDAAQAVWKQWADDAECIQELHEEYDTIELVDMKTKTIVASI